MEEQQTSTMAIVSLVLGIIAILITIPGCCCGLIGGYGCCEIPFSIGAMVTGFMGLSQIKGDPEIFSGKGFAFGGMAAGVVAIILNIIVVLLNMTIIMAQIANM